MKQPTHYYIECQCYPKKLAPDTFVEFLRTIHKQLIKSSGLENILSVIQQSYEKNSAPDEKERLVLIENDFNGSYVFKIEHWELVIIKEAFL